MTRKLLLIITCITSLFTFAQMDSSVNTELDANFELTIKDTSSILEPNLKWLKTNPMFFLQTETKPILCSVEQKSVKTDWYVNPKLKYYTVGQNGIEFVAKRTLNGVEVGTTIVSTFNAKSKIKTEVAEKVFDYFTASNFSSGTIITIESSLANVTGMCYIEIKDTLKVLKFYYSKIEWKDGLIEIFKK